MAANGDEITRLWNRLSDHENRLREGENQRWPPLARLRTDVDQLQTKVTDMDLHGTTVTQLWLRNVEQDIADIKASLETRARDERSQRIRNIGMIAAAGTNIIVGILLALILKGIGAQ